MSHKNTESRAGTFFFATEQAAMALNGWVQFAEITSGPIFRKIGRSAPLR